MHSAQFCFSLPWGQGSHSTQRLFSFPCEHLLFRPIASRAPRYHADSTPARQRLSYFPNHSPRLYRYPRKRPSEQTRERSCVHTKCECTSIALVVLAEKIVLLLGKCRHSRPRARDVAPTLPRRDDKARIRVGAVLRCNRPYRATFDGTGRTTRRFGDSLPPVRLPP